MMKKIVKYNLHKEDKTFIEYTVAKILQIMAI